MFHAKNPEESDSRNSAWLHEWIETYGVVDLLKTIRDIAINKSHTDNGSTWHHIGLAVRSAEENVATIIENEDFETKRREPDWGPDRD